MLCVYVKVGVHDFFGCRHVRSSYKNAILTPVQAGKTQGPNIECQHVQVCCIENVAQNLIKHFP